MAQSFLNATGNLLKEQDDKYLLGVYAKPPIHFVKGKGCVLEDEAGKSYLDFGSGIAVSALGHGHPAIQKAVEEQSQRFLHLSNLYLNDSQVELAEMLVENTSFDKVFFCNSGTEANEAMLKFARKYWAKHGLAKKIEVISFTSGFHGRTYGALSVTAQPKFHKGFGEMVPGSKYVEWNNVQDLLAAVNENTAAIILEPLQGEGGLNSPSKEFVEAINKIQKENGTLILGDEIQTCLGRLGTLLGAQTTELEFDMTTIAKPLGGGLPIGAVLLKEPQAQAMSPGDHGTTFGGNPLSCAAGVAVLKEILADDFLSEVQRKSKKLKILLQNLTDETEGFYEVKGEGLLLGIQTSLDLNAIMNQARENGLLILRAGADVLRLAPPLVVSDVEIEKAIEILKETLLQIEVAS